jgi:hypothetical protein
MMSGQESSFIEKSQARCVPLKDAVGPWLNSLRR